MYQLATILLLPLLVACSGTPKPAANGNKGKQVYKIYCIACHGADGKLKLNEAPDLTLSEMTLTERIENITKGGSMMPAFGEVISEEQIKAVAVYLDELKESE